jgi:hypothetical protein
VITLTEDDAIEGVSDAMSNIHDMDTSLTDFARAAIRYLKEHGAVFAREPDAACWACGKPHTTASCHMGGCPLGAEL